MGGWVGGWVYVLDDVCGFLDHERHPPTRQDPRDSGQGRAEDNEWVPVMCSDGRCVLGGRRTLTQGRGPIACC